MKGCRKCEAEKEEDRFSKGRNVCKECRASQRNIQKYREYKKEYNNREAVKQLKYEYNKIWRSRNPEKMKEHLSKHYYNNKTQYREKAARYRATKQQSTPKWADLATIKDFYLEAEYHQMEVDHIIPLNNKKVCGLHVEHNLQLLSKADNRTKSNKFKVV